ncbi:DUF3027 domain-containing protein [Bifidobacterium oedipodis]|uniref:DUF3027 domain-containing protein n=1 Tax=Bifidobacterium oedipodis TaxID=2675322 RepID=A0A7Y0HSI6_9BIFI|nr:DUF3027 domain-containing protein [Bifidobacterium sp. DSM 109957]NMM93633.1 hypothetical protein [Bifidobacterium sp. DSM 109957]
MSDTIEPTTIETDGSDVSRGAAATPDPQAIAKAVLLEVVDEPDQVGDFVTSTQLEDHVTDFRFAAHIRGYEGWQWSVTMYHDRELDSWTVNESSLIPAEGALLPPKWIAWKDRLEPTDLSPTDSIGTDPDDERMEPGEVAESSLEDVNDAVETFRLTRRHVLSSLGRAQAAKRWYEGPRGPKALSTKTADGNLCSTCGFFVPLAGELDRMFGVCANKWSPDDGRVVSLDHGCGEHSEIEPPEPSHLWVQSKPAFDDLHIDVVMRKPHKTAADASALAEDEESAVSDDAENEALADAADTEAQSAEKVEDAQNTASQTTQGEQSEESAARDTAVAAEDLDATSDDADDVDDSADDIESIDDIDADDLDDDNSDDDDDPDDDEATEEDIIANTTVDDEDDDEPIDDDEPDHSDDIAPELEAVVDLIEKFRQAKSEAESAESAE